MAVLLQVEVAV
jgi:hypothetical protein